MVGMDESRLREKIRISYQEQHKIRNDVLTTFDDRFPSWKKNREIAWGLLIGTLAK